MKKLVSLFLIFSQLSYAGLPPTTAKISSDSVDVATFKFRFPNFTGTRTGTLVSLGVNSVAGGGTGLSTLTSGSLLVGNGTSNVSFLSPVANGNVILDNGTAFTSSTAPSSMSASYNALGLGLAASVSANALTISVRQSDGSSNPDGTNPVYISFRNVNPVLGAYQQRSVTSALSITIPSGTTIGTINSSQEYIYLYALDNGGTVELAVSLNGFFDEGSLATTTAISGGTSRTTLYSTTARTDKAIRLIGRISSNQTTAGTWAANPLEISPITSPRPLQRSQVRLNTNAGQGSTNTRIRRYTNVTDNYGTAITYADSATLGASFTINEDGIYSITVGNGSLSNTTSAGISLNSSQLTTDIGSITAADRLCHGGSQIGGGGTLASGSVGECSWTGWLKDGDVIRSHDVSYAPTTAAHSFFSITKLF